MEKEKLILHIEDNSDNRLLVRRLLFSASYQVLEATSASEAVMILGRYRPDLILMDINMPRVDGYTLTSKFKTVGSLQKIPIIAITANAMKGDREKSLLAGCDGYVEKPIDVDRLLGQIHRFIE
jgi:two-component system cell cycle response regulator DivK